MVEHKAITIATAILIVIYCNKCFAKFEGHIVGGFLVNIEKRPYIAFVAIAPGGNRNFGTYICGASIISQKTLLTAAHCLEDCGPNSFVAAHVGHSNKQLGKVYKVKRFKMHERFGEGSIYTSNDIGLLFVQHAMAFNTNVNKIILMKKPPYNENAFVAGWGLIDEIKMKDTNWLNGLNQTIISKKVCLRVLRELPPGTLCAGTIQGSSYASMGDSGSPLVVRDKIQIGLVSYKKPSVSRSLVVYTDVEYFYNWIHHNMIL